MSKIHSGNDKMHSPVSFSLIKLDGAIWARETCFVISNSRLLAQSNGHGKEIIMMIPEEKITGSFGLTRE